MTVMVFGALFLLAMPAAGGGFQSGAQHPQAVPVDQGSTDPSFAEFRTAMIKAARAGDLENVFSMIAPDVRWTEGVMPGTTRFREHWGIEQDPSHFLELLLKALEGGGRFVRRDLFVAPYTYSEFPDELTHEIHKYIIIAGQDVPVYTAPDINSPIVARLSHAIVDGTTHSDGWAQLLSRPEGYVRSEHVREPNEVRAFFERRSNQWKLTLFAKGFP